MLDPIEEKLEEKLRENGEKIFGDRTHNSSLNVGITQNLLCHYTSIHGFKGIIDRKELFATSCRHMNDKNELFQGLKAIKEAILRPIKMVGSHPRSKAMWPVYDVIEKFINNLQQHHFDNCFAFACCFSESLDDNAQWQMYGGPHQGIGLEFTFDFLQKVANINNALMSCCIYEFESNSVQNLGNVLLSQLSDAAARYLDSKKNTRSKHQLEELSRRLIFRGLSLIKGGEFRAEREWRLLKFGFFSRYDEKFPVDIEFKETPMALKPYLVVPLGNIDNKSSPKSISVVRIGPGAWASGNLLAIELFLRSRGYYFDPDDSSAIQLVLSQSGLR